MKTETIQKANDLIKQMNDLKEHLNHLQVPLNDGGFLAISLSTVNSTYSSRKLISKLLPIPVKDIVMLYESRVIAEIASLEKQLENLKD
jgi:hypothetical protein